MPQKVRIPEPLRELTNNQEFVEVNANTINEVILELNSRFPDISERLLDAEGEIRRFTLFYVNDEDIRFLQNGKTPLKNGDHISIILALIDMRTAQAVTDVANRLRTGQKIYQK